MKEYIVAGLALASIYGLVMAVVRIRRDGQQAETARVKEALSRKQAQLISERANAPLTVLARQHYEELQTSERSH